MAWLLLFEANVAGAHDGRIRQREWVGLDALSPSSAVVALLNELVFDDTVVYLRW